MQSAKLISIILLIVWVLVLGILLVREGYSPRSKRVRSRARVLDISRGAARHRSLVRFQPPSRRHLNYIPLLLYRFLSFIYSLVTTGLRLHTLRIHPLACSIRYFARCNTTWAAMIKVYTNVSGVTPSPPSSRFVPEVEDRLVWLYFSCVVTDVLQPRLPSTLWRVALGKCSVLSYFVVLLFFASERGDGRTSVCRLCQWPLGRRNGGLVGPCTFIVKWNGNEQLRFFSYGSEVTLWSRGALGWLMWNCSSFVLAPSEKFSYGSKVQSLFFGNPSHLTW